MTAGEAYLSRWARLGEAAKRARSVPVNVYAALAVAAVYNLAGFADIASTIQALSLGAQEANPVVRGFMSALSEYWVAPKLLSQALVTAMILWFPHRVVLGVFSLAVLATAAVALNNYQIIAGL